jgi:hypothetical protein
VQPDRVRVEAEHTARVANLAYALFAAQNLDRIKCSIGVAIMATVIVGNDPVAKTMLAREMLKLVNDLDPSLLGARWWQ